MISQSVPHEVFLRIKYLTLGFNKRQLVLHCGSVCLPSLVAGILHLLLKLPRGPAGRKCFQNRSQITIALPWAQRGLHQHLHQSEDVLGHRLWAPKGGEMANILAQSPIQKVDEFNSRKI